MDTVSPLTPILERLPARLCAAWRVVPLGRDGEVVRIGTVAPVDEELRNNVRVLVEAPVALEILSPSAFDERFTDLYGVGGGDLDDPSLASAEASAPEFATDSGMARVVDRLITQALGDRATDIHIEPGAGELAVRLRIDGLLQAVSLPAALTAQRAVLVSRIKFMAGMNIAERRLPQDGRLRFRHADGETDVRVSTIPTIHGETVNLRLLPKNNLVLSLEDLGMADDVRVPLETLITKPSGIVLVTGPTGHGKTTTLYACLSRINSPVKKIVTIEDPVEYRLRGVNQIQAHPKIGLTFASALRSVLRQDPDVLMVGEIRDADTAEIAIRSSLTGHLVLSTLHTNDAADAVTRLVDMGIEPYLVASSLSAVVSQRLVRRRCAACAGGCAACRQTGFRGRLGLFELLVLNDDTRDMIVNRRTARDIRRHAVAVGMRTMFDDGRAKAAAGLTTLDDVRRVVEEDR